MQSVVFCQALVKPFVVRSDLLCKVGIWGPETRKQVTFPRFEMLMDGFEDMSRQSELHWWLRKLNQVVERLVDFFHRVGLSRDLYRRVRRLPLSSRSVIECE
jgi:hypothetical protein